MAASDDEVDEVDEVTAAPEATGDGGRDDVRAVVAAAKLARDRSMIEHGRRIGGLPGAMVAGAMIALRDIYETPKRDDGSVVVDAPSDPHDVDRDGVALAAAEIGGVDDVAVPAQPRHDPLVAPRRRSRRRR